MISKDLILLITEFLGSDALLGLGVVVIAGAVQLFTNGQVWESLAFLVLAFVVLFLRTMRKAEKAHKRDKKLVTTMKNESPEV